MINTFKLITVLGTSDAQNFSSGISEALITTQWGLIVAIPALMLAAFLARKAKTVLDDMEKLSIRFMNQIPEPDEKGDTPPPPAPPKKPAPSVDLDLEIDLDGDALPQT
jgi:biopolymer transport protein ExbB